MTTVSTSEMTYMYIVSGWALKLYSLTHQTMMMK